MVLIDERVVYSDGMEMFKASVFDKLSCRDDPESQEICNEVRKLDEERERTILAIKKYKQAGEYAPQEAGYKLLAKIADQKEALLKRGSALAFGPSTHKKEA